MNSVVLMGRLTRDPEVRYSQGERPNCIARYTLAVDRRYRSQNSDQPTADYISCLAFGKFAEIAEKYFKQGTKITIRGRIQTGSYTNRDGQKVYTTDVVVEDQEFAESKASAGQAAGAAYSPQPTGSAPSGTYRQQSSSTNPNGNYPNPPAGTPQPPTGNFPGPQGNGASMNYGNSANSRNSGSAPTYNNPTGFMNQPPVGNNMQQGNSYNDPTVGMNSGFMNVPDGIDEELPFS